MDSVVGTVRWGRGGLVALVVAALGVAGCPMGVPAATAAAPVCTISGSPRAEVLSGTRGDDVICGLGGNDQLSGGGGNDVLFGGGGDDVLLGGAGRDLLRGGRGDDVMRGGAGNDGLRGAPGDDLVGGGLGADRLRGSEGGDVLSGGAGRDVVTYMPRAAGLRLSIGDGGNDGGRGEGDDIAADVEDLRGGAGNDTLIGSGGANRLFGLAGNDRVVGGRGNDVLAGGGGSDVLDGVDGAGFVDELSCGDGAGDRVLADMGDTVGAGCENVVQNDPPSGVVLSDDTVAENRPVGTIVGVLSATDPDLGDTHTFTLVTGAGSGDNGSFTITGDRLRTDEVFDFETKDTYSIRVRARDAEGSTVVEPFTITIVGADEPPAAVDDTATVAEDDSATAVAVLANDTDVDGGPKVIDSVTQPANGTVVITGGGAGLTYEPDPNYCNDPPGTTPDAFTYTLNGGSTATVAVTVTCVDDAPVAVNDTATVVEDAVATGIDVLGNDTDVEGDPITVASVTQPANGTVVITAGGTGLSYEPAPDYCNSQPGGTPDTFTYTVTGGSTATVSVTVTCVDDAPVAVDDTATVAEDDPATAVDVLANDTDIDGGPKVIGSVTQPANGTVVITGGGSGLTYEPDPNSCNDPPGTTPDSFTYTVTGGSTATVAVTVTCVDDAPVAVDDTATVAEDAAATGIDVLANDTDIDGGPKVIGSVTQPDNGIVAVTGAGDGLTYEPAPNYCNDPPGTTPDSFTYTLNGGDSATVSVTVTCVDDTPVAGDDTASVVEDAAATAVDVLANDVDPDGGVVTIASVTQPANGTVVITGGGTGLTYQPNANYCNNPPGTTPDTFTYTINGGDSATVSMTVTCVDDPPVAVNDTATVAEDAAATAVDVLTNDTDIDGGPKVIGSVTQPANGTVVITGAGGGLTYRPNANYCNNPPGTTPDTFTYTLNGGDDATVTVTVTCVDDPPVAVNDSATVLEDAAASAVGVLTNDTDVDAGPKVIGSVTQPANGTVVITGAGSGLTYQPAANYCNNPPGTSPDTFTYTLNGGSVATVSVTVTCVNDPPVADDETFNGANSAVGNTSFVVNDPDDPAPTVTGPNKTISGDLLTGDTDIDGPGPLAIVAGTIASNDGGSVTIQADGDFVFTPVAGTSCTDTTDTFNYTVSDQNPGTPGTDTGTVTITIANCVWYVSNNAAGNAGTSSAPFDTLAQADTATPAGDVIFIFDGNNSTSGYTAGVTLEANQRLIGEAADLVVGGTTLHTAVPANRPTISDNNSDVVDLASGNTVTGIDIDPQGTGGGIAGGTGDAGGTITNVNIADTAPFGTQPGVELDATSGTWNLSSLTVSTNGATGVRLNNAGTVNFASVGTITITTAGAKALDATGATTSFGTSSVLDDVTVTGSATGAINLSATTGALTLGDGAGTDLALTTTSGSTAALFSTHTGALTVNPFGTDNISATGGPAVDVTGPGSFEFDTVTSTGSSTDGINLAGLGTGTFTAAATGDLTGAAGIAFDLDGGSGTITYPGTIGNGTGASVDITGRTGGTVTLSGAITDTNDAGGGITLSGDTGGTTIISNATKTLNTGASDAITFTSSNGHTLNLTGGGLDIDTTSGRGIHADDAGTITVTGTNNTINTTTGTALGVTTTDIAATGLTLQSISASGAPNGIVLNTTGSAGSLVITGDGDGNPDGGGGTIQNTTGHGISLNGTLSPSLTDMTVTNAGNADNEYGLLLTNVGGTVTLDDMTFNNAADNLVYLTSTSSSTINVTGSAFSYPGVISGTANSAMLLEPSGAANLTASITGSTFTDIFSASTQIGANTAGATGTLSLTFSNNTINSATGRAGGVVVSGQELTTTSLSITNNTFTGAGGNGVISIDTNDASTVTGTISNNGINNPPGIGIFSAVDEDATSTLTFNGNTITNSGGDGIQLVNFGSPTQPSLTSEMNATVTNNIVNGHSLNTAVSFVGGISVTGFEEVMDLQLTGNTVTGTPAGPTQCGGAPCVDYYLEEVGGTFRLEEIPNTAATTASAAYVNSTNDAGPVTIFGVIDLSNGVEISSS